MKYITIVLVLFGINLHANMYICSDSQIMGYTDSIKLMRNDNVAQNTFIDTTLGSMTVKSGVITAKLISAVKRGLTTPPPFQIVQSIIVINPKNKTSIILRTDFMNCDRDILFTDVSGKWLKYSRGTLSADIAESVMPSGN